MSMLSVLLCSLKVAQAAVDLVPPPVREASIEERLGQPAMLDISVREQHGVRSTLREVLDPNKPTVLVLAYYRCPMLCGLTLRGLSEGLGGVAWEPGTDYNAVTVSFDPRDRPEAGDRARAAALDVFGRPVAADAWPFFVGSDAQVRQLADSLGFSYAYDEKSDQYAHPAVAFILTPDGTISRYLYGFEYRPLDLRLALVEAGKGEVASLSGLAEQVLLTCFRYDPTTRRFGPYVFGILRLGAASVILMAGIVGFLLFRHERRRKRSVVQEERG